MVLYLRGDFMIPLIIILGIFMMAYMGIYYKLNIKIVFLFKIATSICFLVLGFVCFYKSEVNGNYPILIVIGLGFGFLGDIILGLRRLCPKHKIVLYVFGLIMFFCGHIFYSMAFLSIAAYNLSLYFIATIILTVPIIIAMKSICVNSNKVKYINYLYLTLLIFIIVITIMNLTKYITIVNVILLIGSLLFVGSDLILYFLYFMYKKDAKKLKMMNIASYYIAQTLFALSIYYL